MKSTPCFSGILLLTSVLCGAAPRPNVVVILCDDLGYGDLGCYGNKIIKTPNLDKLAADGICLTSAYSAAPVCSPSRVGLLTGRNPNLAGVYDWIPEAEVGGANSRNLVHMRDTETTIPMLLKTQGYATALAGKWHCNSVFNDPSQPQPDDMGFDYWFATQRSAYPSHENPVNFVRNGKPVGEMDGFSCQIVAAEGIGWMKSQLEKNAEQPFFLYLTFHEPHEPVASPKELVAQYRDKAENENQAEYFANVANVDLAVGKVLAALDEAGVRENTLIIFTSDNGPETHGRYAKAAHSYGSAGALKGMKLWTHEGGFRVPGIINWQGTIPAGQVSDVPVVSFDFLPTFVNLAEGKLPEIELHGTDLSSFLKGGELKRETPLFWAFYNATNEHRIAMRDGDWKIMAKLNHGKLPKYQNIDSANSELVASAELTDFLLYNIAEDPAEADELSGKEAEKLAELSKKLQAAYHHMIETMHTWSAK